MYNRAASLSSTRASIAGCLAHAATSAQGASSSRFRRTALSERLEDIGSGHSTQPLPCLLPLPLLYCESEQVPPPSSPCPGPATHLDPASL